MPPYMYQPIYSIYYICTPLVYYIYTLNIFFLFIIYLPLHACLKLFVSDCWRQTYDYYEFYAGVGNITRQARPCGYKALRFDILDNKKPTDRKSNFMDLASPSGWALLVGKVHISPKPQRKWWGVAVICFIKTGAQI